MDEARQLIVQFMQTREYEDAVFSGIGLDDNVHWPSSRITACLCETETMLAQVGVDAFFRDNSLDCQDLSRADTKALWLR